MKKEEVPAKEVSSEELREIITGKRTRVGDEIPSDGALWKVVEVVGEYTAHLQLVKGRFIRKY